MYGACRDGCKCGSEVIEDDPNDISGNGKLLLDFVKEQNLRIPNCSPKCIEQPPAQELQKMEYK